MSIKRVTMQDIADACGLSRNTVSKVFNSRGAVPEATRALIRQKARELGYGMPVPAKSHPAGIAGASIALLTNRMPAEHHFGTFFMTTFTDQISRAGYTLKIFEISAEELRQKQLPPHFIPEQTAGIVGIELFDTGYLDMISTLGLPMIVIDSPPHANSELMYCDYVCMESIASVTKLMEHLRAQGARRIGFVGDKEHCGSFYERWVGYNIGLRLAGAEPDIRSCILAPDDSPYDDPDWLIAQMDRMPSLPDAFLCANDYLAVRLMTALKKKGLDIPGDIMVTGFDGTFQSSLVEPALTTVEIPSLEIGKLAADFLLMRIRNPGMAYHWTHVKTTPVLRESTLRQK